MLWKNALNGIGDRLIILGMSAHHGDSSACIVRDGRLIAAIEEERFRRVKHWAGFPSRVIQLCLEEAGATLADVDHITVSSDPNANYWHKVKHALAHPSQFKRFVCRLLNSKKATSLTYALALEFKVYAGSVRDKIVGIEHHLSHIASAYFASLFGELAVLSINGFGDFRP